MSDPPLSRSDSNTPPAPNEGTQRILREYQRGENVRALLLIGLRATFLVLIIGTVSLTLASARSSIGGFPAAAIVGTLLSALAAATLVLVADVMTPRKHLASVLGIYIGVSFGLVAALGFAALVDIVADAWELAGNETAVYLGLTKGVAGISLVYISVSVVLSTKDDFRIVIPYVQLEKRALGVNPLLLDTSAIIDGRLVDLARTGIVDAPIIVQRYVIDELQALADSSDRHKRERGRRGLDVLRRLQEVYPDTLIEDSPTTEEAVDRKLIETAQREGYRIVTTDAALAKIAQIQKVGILNVNDVASSLRMHFIPGDKVDVEIVRKGESEGQGIGFMPDGTMLVIEGAHEYIGETISVDITNTLQRSGSRLIFGKVSDHADNGDRPAEMARAATQQAPMRERPKKENSDPTERLPRNPRRNR